MVQPSECLVLLLFLDMKIYSHMILSEREFRNLRIFGLTKTFITRLLLNIKFNFSKNYYISLFRFRSRSMSRDVTYATCCNMSNNSPYFPHRTYFNNPEIYIFSWSVMKTTASVCMSTYHQVYTYHDYNVKTL